MVGGTGLVRLVVSLVDLSLKWCISGVWSSMGLGLRESWKKGREGREEKRKGEEKGQVGRGEKRIGHLQGE